MSTVRAYGAATLGMAQRDWRLFISYRTRFLTQLLSGFFSIVLFYYVSRMVGGSRLFPTPDDYFAFAVVGLVVMGILVSTLSTLPVTLRQELVAGTLERLVVSPFGAVAAIAAMAWFPFAVALVNGVLALTVAALVFGMPVEWSTAALAAPVGALGALAFAPFALLVAGAVILVKQAGAGAGFVVTGISLVGGFFFPVTLLPSWIRWVSDVQPFTPAVNLLRHLLVGTPLADSPWLLVLKLVGFAAVLLPLALMVLRLTIRAAQRRGTIIEY
jgi:ABC-2 type transport system permease protein